MNRFFALLMATVLLACKSKAASPPAGPQPGTAATDLCTGLENHVCAQTKGCILDQVTAEQLQCRQAQNACEGAVRHADLIGNAADPAVTDAKTTAAQAACRANAACAVTKGACACACAVLGTCACECGGDYFPRCVLKADEAFFNGRPPGTGTVGNLAPWRDALAAVRRATGAQAYVVDPFPQVNALLGQPRNLIEAALGTGTRCVGPAMPSAPCQNASQVFYSLYKLPTGSVGGGPELLLTYDAQRVCTDAAIAHTR